MYIMKTIVKLMAILFVVTIFIGCDDNNFKHIKTGDGVMYYGHTINGSYYGFVGGDLYFLEDTEETDYVSLLDVLRIKKDIYSLTYEYLKSKEYSPGSVATLVLRKNGKYIDTIPIEYAYLCNINENVRIYSMPFFITTSTDIQQYWENGNMYENNLDAPTLNSMTLWAVAEQNIYHKGDIYSSGYLYTANGKTPCIWKNNQLLYHDNPLINTNLSSKGFIIDKNDNIIVLSNYFTTNSYDINSPHGLAATYKNGQLDFVYGDTVRFKTDFKYNVRPIGIVQENNDIYVGVYEINQYIDQNKVIIYKNNEVYITKDLAKAFYGFTVKDGNVYFAYDAYYANEGFVGQHITIMKNNDVINGMIERAGDQLMFKGFEIVK